MNKVITINLNGRAFQVEEEGFAKLKSYLDEAASRLENDPDKAEIISDLEQALAEKLQRYLNQNKTVITDQESALVIKEMGPVQSTAENNEAGEKGQKEKANEPAKRLYKISEAGIIRGVCAGLAAYFNIDVTLMRIIFVALAVLTHGLWILVYIVMMVVLPEAKSSEQVAAAFGQPFTAQEWVDRSREEYRKFANRAEWRMWKHELKNKIRAEKYARTMRYDDYGSNNFFSPFFGLLIAIITIFWIFGFFTIIAKGAIFGWMIPASIPLIVSLLVWIILFGLVTSSLRAPRYQNCAVGQAHYCRHRYGFFGFLFNLALLALILWAVWHFLPDTHPYFEQGLIYWNRFVDKLRIY
jgi:phage shock protein PspC (stress-responsive transcriptional regulator)